MPLDRHPSVAQTNICKQFLVPGFTEKPFEIVGRTNNGHLAARTRNWELQLVIEPRPLCSRHWLYSTSKTALNNIPALPESFAPKRCDFNSIPDDVQGLENTCAGILVPDRTAPVEIQETGVMPGILLVVECGLRNWMNSIIRTPGLIDTGASHNLITLDTVKDLGLMTSLKPLVKQDPDYVNSENLRRSFPIISKIVLMWHAVAIVPKEEYDAVFYVTHELPYDMIICLETSCRRGLIHLHPALLKEINSREVAPQSPAQLNVSRASKLTPKETAVAKRKEQLNELETLLSHYEEHLARLKRSGADQKDIKATRDYIKGIEAQMAQIYQDTLRPQSRNNA